MHIFRKLPLVFVILMPCHVHAADAGAEQHAIDAVLESNIARDSSTQGMRQAMAEAQRQWDVELNATYKRLMAKLDAAGQASLRDTQRSWIQFRDAELKAIRDVVAAQPGTVHMLSASEFALQLVRERALTLAAYEKELAN
jgi:uncharacterized protein YecT (DUF1311 family)